MPTHVTHGGQWVSTVPGQGQGGGQGHPPPFAQLPVFGVTADSTLWTADTIAVTADGKVLYISASVVEAASALDTLDAVAIAGGAVISADVAEAADAFDTPDAVSSVSADAIEAANALDVIDAVTDVAADAIEVATAIDELDAAVGANVLFGTVDEAANALDQLHADVDAEAGGIVDGGGAFYPPQQRPYPIVGHGYGILPRLEGEAHGVVGAVGKSAAQLVVHATAIGVCGQAGTAVVSLSLAVAGKGVVGNRGNGTGTIMKFSGSATGHHDDDEAAVIAILLAA